MNSRHRFDHVHVGVHDFCDILQSYLIYMSVSTCVYFIS